MIRRSDGELVCDCDECGAEFYGGVEDDFRVFVDSLKKEGWKISKDGDAWHHACPDCQEG